MWFDDGIIKKCSECSCFILETHLISGNTMGAIYWTDGKMEAPMLPEEPELIKCHQCNALVWLAELQEIEASDYNNKDIVNSVEQYVITPTFDDYFSFLEMGCLESKKELYIRIRAWWAGNDCRRRGETDKPLSESEIKNLTMLAEILSEEEDDYRIMKAEIFRELGLFKEASYLIHGLRGRNHSLAGTTILSMIDNERSHLVRLIDEEGPPPVAQSTEKNIRQSGTNMTRAIFKTFKEAAAYSKNLSVTIKASTSVKRDGDIWWVDDPRTEKTVSQPVAPSQVPEPVIQSSQYDADGFDAEGFDIEGFDRNEKDRDGNFKYPF